MGDKVHGSIVRERATRLRAKIGRRIDVLVDAIDEDVAIARGSADAPEIDGVVRIAAGARLALGQLARVTITSADAHDLRAALSE